MVHWPETMVTYDTVSKALYSCDAFGSFGALDGGLFDDQIDLEDYRGETYRYYSNIVGKYSTFVERALAKVDGLDLGMICPAHGPLYRKDPGYIVELYRSMARQDTDRAVLVVYGSMYGNTARLAEAAARGIHDQGVTDVTVMDSATADLSSLIQEAWRCRGLILVGCSYNGGVFPKIAHFMDMLESKKMSRRFVGICGSYTWSKGAAMKPLRLFAEQAGWTKVEPEVEIVSRPTEHDLDMAVELGRNVADAVIGGVDD